MRTSSSTCYNELICVYDKERGLNELRWETIRKQVQIALSPACIAVLEFSFIVGVRRDCVVYFVNQILEWPSWD